MPADNAVVNRTETGFQRRRKEINKPMIPMLNIQHQFLSPSFLSSIDQVIDIIERNIIPNPTKNGRKLIDVCGRDSNKMPPIKHAQLGI